MSEQVIKQKISTSGISICGKCIHLSTCKAVANQPCIECSQFAEAQQQAWWHKITDEKFLGYDVNGRIIYRMVSSYRCTKCCRGTAVKSSYCPGCGSKMSDTVLS